MVAEKNSVWRVGRHGRHDALDGGQEAHVEHAVGFIQNQDADAGEVDQLAAEEIEEAAGGGDQPPARPCGWPAIAGFR